MLRFYLILWSNGRDSNTRLSGFAIPCIGPLCHRCIELERGRRIELLALAWKAKVLPLYEPRMDSWSGRRGSNSRHQPWQGCTLPTELRPHYFGGPDRTRTRHPHGANVVLSQMSYWPAFYLHKTLVHGRGIEPLLPA
jgi:hypothetical protein